MSAFDIVAIVVLSCIVAGVAAYLIYRRVKGKGPDCDCDCDSCSMCSHCDGCKKAQEMRQKKKSDK